ncbi:Uu.00g008120.m01.CDS01 [Anthostomella pinea]|uniref:Uu.00g008120.m01.CDS01 n=1 Tax=Anthostomella pinea TaxID=933095 RepID=A0AAI8YPU2_9PEZI|nr:Uu.00g008120.m01.CDS01 [Anthostomella pinea]
MSDDAANDANDMTPLLPRPTPNPPQADSHPIYLRACHSPWKSINQKALLAIRTIVAGYLTAVMVVSLIYKLGNGDDHGPLRIPFQFSTVANVLLWAYHMQVTLWTGMHLFMPRSIEDDPEMCHGHMLRVRIARVLSPPEKVDSYNKRFTFSMFYTIAHVFTFMNTLIYWGILVPTGHGGFKPPTMPHHDHPSSISTANGTPITLYDADKGLFEEGPLKAFSIINVWTITSLIAVIEILFLNSIRRQNPVAGHVYGCVFLSAVYLAWAGLGILLTGHGGLFFLDPKLMGDVPGANIAAGLAFISMTPGIFAYMYGLIAMRETVTAAQRSSSQ